MKKIFAIFILAIFGFCFFGCDQKQPADKKDPVKPVLAITETSKELKVGDTYTFEVEIQILMESSNNSVVTCNESAKTITAVGAGEATITIYALEDTTVFKTVTVTVESDEPEGPVAPETIEIVFEKTEIYLDETLQLSFKVYPEGASQEVIWTTGQRTYVDLTDEGLVTPLRGGTAKIKVASAVDTTVNASIEIKIMNCIDPDKFFSTINFENPANEIIKVFGWAEGSSYEYNLLGSVTKYYFGDIDITVDYSPMATITEKTDPETGEKYDVYSNGRSGEKIHGYRYVVVHDTAETRTNGTALSLGNWVETDDSSWHFAVDDKNIVQKIPMDEVAWHAGDGAIAEDAFFKNTGIKAEGTEPAKVTISSD